MSHSKEKQNIEKRDVLAGALLLLVGVSGSLIALEFDGESRAFPLVIAGLLAVIGIGIVIGSILKPTGSNAPGQNIVVVLVAVLIIAAWTAALAGGGGFVIPTFAMQASLLWITGIRRPTHVAGIAALVTMLSYLLFVVLLNVPLPPSLLPDALQGF